MIHLLLHGLLCENPPPCDKAFVAQISSDLNLCLDGSGDVSRARNGLSGLSHRTVAQCVVVLTQWNLVTGARGPGIAQRCKHWLWSEFDFRNWCHMWLSLLLVLFHCSESFCLGCAPLSSLQNAPLQIPMRTANIGVTAMLRVTGVSFLLQFSMPYP